jgi:YVTN family beta-propeller protein
MDAALHRLVRQRASGVTNATGDTESVIDTSSHSVTSTINVDSYPNDVAIQPTAVSTPAFINSSWW